MKTRKSIFNGKLNIFSICLTALTGASLLLTLFGWSNSVKADTNYRDDSGWHTTRLYRSQSGDK